MVVSEVHLAADAYMVCLTHALSTEKEEIMGLLIGEIDPEHHVSHISAVIMLRRSDKQPDRVEISPEQLSDASTKAEQLARQLGRPLRVIGWYHSHPHITVWPSHVDVRTQAMYQMMDECFIGLIFSVFNEDKQTKQNRIQVTCFQSTNHSPEGQTAQYTCNQQAPVLKDKIYRNLRYQRLEVPLHIVPQSNLSQACLESLVQLPHILSLEEQEAYMKTTRIPDLDLLTQIHNGSIFTKSVCQILEVMTAPLMHSLESRQEANAQEMKRLEKEKEQLIAQLNEMR